MTNIFIANLDFDITSDDLKATFSQFGEVSYAHVVFDKKTKKSKGYGYIEMDNEDEALTAIKALNGVDVNGRAIDVKKAAPKGERPKNTNPKQDKEQDSKFKEKRPSFRQKKQDHPIKTVKEAAPKRVLRPRRKKKD